MPTQQKVRNWRDYNRALKKRGEILLSFDKNYLGTLYYQEEQKRGGIRKYSPQMYEYLLTIKVMLRLPWRAAIGFAECLLKKAFSDEEIEVPDYAHASREAGKLDLKIKALGIKPSEGMELAFDSTGVNVYTTSGYHQRRYGKESLYRQREQWKKIHLVLELNTMQVVSMSYTDSNVNDCEVVGELSRQIDGEVRSVRADGAYDTEEFYQIIAGWGAKALIPPAKTSKAQDELKVRGKKKRQKKAHLQQRDQTIKQIRRYEEFEQGLKQWKIGSGYHRRSLIESCMFRLKRTFGFYLQHKTDHNRRNEIITKLNILNNMSALGRAEYCV